MSEVLLTPKGVYDIVTDTGLPLAYNVTPPLRVISVDHARNLPLQNIVLEGDIKVEISNPLFSMDHGLTDENSKLDIHPDEFVQVAFEEGDGLVPLVVNHFLNNLGDAEGKPRLGFRAMYVLASRKIIPTTQE